MNETKTPFSILVISSEGNDLPRVREKLTKNPPHPTSLDISTTLKDGIEKIKRGRYHLILADSSIQNGIDIKEILQKINQTKVTAPVILMVKPGEEALTRRALKSGATDSIVKTDEGLENLPQRLWTLYRSYELTPAGGLKDELALQDQKLMDVNEKFRELSLRDELTGLYNHRYLQERLIQEYIRAARYGHALSCLLVDLDLFRKINNQLGHTVGDEILKEAAELLLEGSRLSDLVSRFGGEEFVVLLPHVDYSGAFELADRLRTLFAEHTFLVDSHQISLTVSIGISCFPDDAMKHRSDLLNFADQALFRAKAAGRNRVSLYRDLTPLIGETFPSLKISEEKIQEFQRRLSEISDSARRGYVESSRALILALESKDPYTAGHSGRVARLGLQVAETMGLSLAESEVIEHAGLLHDIGKICISDEVLLKPDRFSLGEYEAMRQHAYFGYRIVKPIKFLHEEATLVLHHHEWFNGEGYPCRLARNEIPLGARIISVVDSYDTMRLAGGRYKKTMSVEEAVNELIAYAGTQFDPEVVEAFIQVLLMRKELVSENFDRERLRQAIETTHPHSEKI